MLGFMNLTISLAIAHTAIDEDLHHQWRKFHLFGDFFHLHGNPDQE